MERDPRALGEKPEAPEYGTPDDDLPELTHAAIARSRPAREFFAERGLPMPGRPPSADKKVAVSIRLDPKIVAYFRGTGAGWQTRLNDMLGEAIKAEKDESGQ
ncbi:BrnA antitoxin family protein [Devosia sp.]|uniref:BrnA antitoxin family protein n=1 Tax=Devosia sp. TaxID=1871048 RepID=UPI002624A9DB|nr:BrnA antitoxin family protein [Devosia sp.]